MLNEKLNCISPETRAALEDLICEALDKREKTQNAAESALRRVRENFQDDLSAFNYIYHWDTVTPDGRNLSYDFPRPMDSQLRNAIYTLLRAVYQVKCVRKIPADKEDDLCWFISELLSLMRELQKRNS